ncbi:MAG: response regulator [Planctomycetes bacterium]|nr:response regulator [Planctomycetota bacterium]
MMSRKRVVVVDDEPHICHVLALKLARGGFEVMIAGDGEEALDLCLAEKPDLLITDYQMPVMSGLELCRRLRQEPSTADVPAIMLTARGFDLDESETAQTGIAAIMSKPFSPAEVLQAAVDVLNCQPVRSREA